MWKRIPEWFTPFKKIEYSSKEKNTIGETVHIIAEKGEMDATTLEMEKNNRIAWQYFGGIFTGKESFTLTAKKNGVVLVSDVFEYHLNNSSLDESLRTSFHEALESTFDVCLLKLKVLAELEPTESC